MGILNQLAIREIDFFQWVELIVENRKYFESIRESYRYEHTKRMQAYT